MLIPDPDFFYPSRIPDPETATKERDEKKFDVIDTFLCSHKFDKIVNYISFDVLKRKIWVNFQRIIELFTQKFVTKLSKVWVWDLGSEIWDLGSEKNLFRILGSKRHRIQDPGSGSATLLAVVNMMD
jgi:hypothetical protein